MIHETREAVAVRLGRLVLCLVVPAFILACPADRRPDEATEAPGERATEPETEAPDATDAAPAETPEDETAQAEAPADDGPLGPPRVAPSTLVPGDGELYGILRTNQGVIVVRFYEDEAPLTVANFVGLATGKVRYQNPETNAIETGNFYDGTIFHRVIPEFMIQGGDPTGTGRGGPGYRFEDERQTLRFDRSGLLAMANAGPNTNGSQFFITEGTPRHLDGRHTIFGSVISGLEVAHAIARVERGPMDRPREPVVLERVEIVRAAEPPTP
jgi:peptidyl-prolyl cis-trans isomerase A (cyclophilin A)